MRDVGVYIADLLLIAFATVLALLLRDNFEFSPFRLAALLPYLGATLLVAGFVLPALGITRMVSRFSGLNDYLRICAAAVISVLGALALAFMINRMGNVSRSMPIIQGLLIMLFLIGTRVGRRLHHATEGKATMWTPPSAFGAQETIVVVGINRLTDLYLRALAEFAPVRVHVAGILEPETRHKNRTLRQFPVLGTPEDAARVRRDLEVHGIELNRIVVASRFSDLSEIAREALLDVEKTSATRVEFIAEQLGLDEPKSLNAPPSAGPDPEPAKTGGTDHRDLSLFEIAPERLRVLAGRPYWRLKRILDGAFALLLLAVLAPVMLLVSMLVLVDVGMPLAFWQQRPGLAGRPFRLYKFRTMASAHDARGRRVPDEKRLSMIGRFLRRTRLDELPQLLNILSGEMSFIGPRPLLPIDQPAAYSARLLVRPGLTGWAQVKGGRIVSPADKAALDIWYVKKASFVLDISIVLQTVRLVLWGERTDQAAIDRAWRDLVTAGVWKGSTPSDGRAAAKAAVVTPNPQAA